MTCNDCVHESACLAYNGGMTRTMSMKNKAEEKCGLFKNKADFAEVPCRCEKCKFKDVDAFNQTVCRRQFNVVKTEDDNYCKYGEKVE